MAQNAERAPKRFVGILDYYFVNKAPLQIPPAGRQAIVRFGPWIVMVLFVLTIPAALLALGITWEQRFTGSWAYRIALGRAAVGLVVYQVLLAAAVPGLFARRQSGWTLMVFAALIGSVTSMLSGLIVSGLLGGLAALYVLFQVRSLYR